MSGYREVGVEVGSFRAPKPFRAALPLAALGPLPIACALLGVTPWTPALVVAAGFALLACIRGALRADELAAMRRTADGLLRTGVRRNPHSPLLAWRAAELTSDRNRKILSRSLGGVIRELEGRTLPGPSPLNAARARPHLGLIRQLRDRLANFNRPVTERGVVYVQDLLTDGFASPLYARERISDLRGALEHCLAELDGVHSAPHGRRNGSAGTAAVDRVAATLARSRAR
jgi:hypothetical protein